MCAVLAVWSLGHLVDACIGLASSSEVWEYELEYNTRGLSLFQLLLHLYLAALLGLGLLAHSSRDVHRARSFLLGFVAFVLLQLVFQITRVATIEQDAQVYRQQRCAHCMELLKADTCDAVQACTEYDVRWFASQSCQRTASVAHSSPLCRFKSLAYVVGLAEMALTLLASTYICLLARSFLRHLEDEAGGAGLAAADSLQAPELNSVS